MTTILIVVLLILALGGGGLGYSRYGAAGGVGPIGLFLIIFAVLYLMGFFH